MKKASLIVILLSAAITSGCGMMSHAPPESAVRSTRVIVDDSTITSKVKAALVADPEISALKIDVGTEKGIVTLKGKVKSVGLRGRAEVVARGVAGVKSVNNQLVVSG